MCNLHSLTKGQAAIRDWFRVSSDRTGNLPLFPGIFPDQMAPIVRNGADGERELVMARWGMSGPPQFGGAPITNIRNVGSPHWRGWLGEQVKSTRSTTFRIGPMNEPPYHGNGFRAALFVCWLVRLPSLIAWQLTVQPCEVICTTSGALCWWTPGERRLAPRPDRIGCGDFFAKNG
jgi:hypothetical protein